MLEYQGFKISGTSLLYTWRDANRVALFSDPPAPVPAQSNFFGKLSSLSYNQEAPV